MSSIIEVKNLNTILGDKKIHENLNFFINSGEIFAIIGGSGSGKTVLLRELLGLITPYSGTIKILGVNAHREKRRFKKILENDIGVLFQSGGLISSLNVIQNVVLPIKEKTNLKIDIINELGLLKLKMANFPLESIFLYPSELSGGMVKRAALARSLIMDPKILFLDEPTSGLDPVSANLFNETIGKLRDLLNITIVIITHDLSTINSIVDRMIVLLKGKIIAQGRVDEVKRTDHPWIKQYFQINI
ncbi:ABC transporter ATP-binding protein [Desulfothermus naphthae]